MKNAWLIALLPILILACTTRPAEGNFSSLTILDSPVSSQASLPYLITGKDGSLYFSWVENVGDTAILKYTSRESESWAETKTITSGSDWFVNWADYPMLGINHQKTILAHYLAKSSAGTYSYDVNIMILNSGQAGWTGPVTPHQDHTPTEHGFVTMLPLPDQTFQVSWLDGRNTAGGHEHHGAMTLRTAVLDSSGKLAEEAELDDRVCDCCQTTGALTENGPVIVYRDRSELEIRDLAIVRKLDGKWTQPKTVYADNWNITGCPVNGPRMEAIENSLVIAWFTAANNQPQVKVIFSSNGGESFGKPVIIDHQTPLGRVDVVMLTKTKAMISWLTRETGKAYIKAQVVYANGDTEPPIIVSETNEARKSGFPQMEKFKDEVFFAWVHGVDTTKIKLAKIGL